MLSCKVGIFSGSAPACYVLEVKLDFCWELNLFLNSSFKNHNYDVVPQ